MRNMIQVKWKVISRNRKFTFDILSNVMFLFALNSSCWLIFTWATCRITIHSLRSETNSNIEHVELNDNYSSFQQSSGWSIKTNTNIHFPWVVLNLNVWKIWRSQQFRLLCRRTKESSQEQTRIIQKIWYFLLEKQISTDEENRRKLLFTNLI